MKDPYGGWSHQPLAKGKGVAARRGPKEAGGKTTTGGTRTRSEAARSDEWALNHKVQAIKGQSGKSGRDVGTANVLIWGDLTPGGLRPQPTSRGVAEAAGVSRGHSTESLFSGRAEHREDEYNEQFAG